MLGGVDIADILLRSFATITLSNTPRALELSRLATRAKCLSPICANTFLCVHYACTRMNDRVNSRGARRPFRPGRIHFAADVSSALQRNRRCNPDPSIALPARQCDRVQVEVPFWRAVAARPNSDRHCFAGKCDARECGRGGELNPLATESSLFSGQALSARKKCCRNLKLGEVSRKVGVSKLEAISRINNFREILSS